MIAIKKYCSFLSSRILHCALFTLYSLLSFANIFECRLRTNVVNFSSSKSDHFWLKLWNFEALEDACRKTASQSWGVCCAVLYSFLQDIKKSCECGAAQDQYLGVSQTFNLILPLFVFCALALFCMEAPIVLSISGLLLEAKVSLLIPPLLFNTLPTPTSMTSQKCYIHPPLQTALQYCVSSDFSQYSCDLQGNVFASVGRAKCEHCSCWWISKHLE